MCGINGFNFVDKALIKKMNDSLKHRGPDDKGIYNDGLVALGHRRLSILDLSKKGSQPMTYTHKRKKVIIVYNGEIYNFREIKKDLSLKGYKFNSDSDTEVILASYIEWGINCVKKFNGMWAFCIYDINKNIFFLSRDRIGKKPLYYFFNKNKFIFSSELKPILCHSLKKEINLEAIDLYFSMGFIPSPYSIYKNIFKLEPRQNLVFNLKTKKIQKYFYYEVPKYSPEKNKKYLINQANKILEDSVRLRMISDVPLGAFLSGGLDSSAIIKKMSNFTSLKNLHTFSIGFEGDNDETLYSNFMKNFLKTKHSYKYFSKKDFKKLLKEIYFYFDEPFFDHSMFPSISLSEISRKKITVSLSGDGGDEIFGGYPRYNIALKIELLKKIPSFLRKFLLKIIPNVKRLDNLKEGLRLSLFPKEGFYSEARSNIYKPDIYKSLMKKKLSDFLKLSKGNLTEAVIMMDLYFYTIPDNFLTKTDRASMARSLEVRCPFLDYRLLNLASKIPTSYKISFLRTKILMRDMLKKDLPKKILKRKKVGFMPPVVDWINEEENFNKIIDKLHSFGLLNNKWKNFFKELLDKEDKVSKTYKARLFLFYKWCEYWKII